MVLDMRLIHIINCVLKHDEPSNMTNQHADYDEQPTGGVALIFKFPGYISMVTINSILDTIPCARKYLYNQTLTKALILHLISDKLLGLEKRDEPATLSLSVVMAMIPITSKQGDAFHIIGPLLRKYIGFRCITITEVQLRANC